MLTQDTATKAESTVVEEVIPKLWRWSRRKYELPDGLRPVKISLKSKLAVSGEMSTYWVFDGQIRYCFVALFAIENSMILRVDNQNFDISKVSAASMVVNSFTGKLSFTFENRHYTFSYIRPFLQVAILSDGQLTMDDVDLFLCFYEMMSDEPRRLNFLSVYGP